MKSTTPFRFLLVSRVLLAGLALSGAAAPAVFAASFTSFTVNTQFDTHDNNPGDKQCAGADGKCSLRAAIEESNALPGFPTEDITLPSGTYLLTLGTLEIKNSLTLNGAGSSSTIIDGNRGFRVFFISKGTNPIVNISGVTIRNGFGDVTLGTGIVVSEGTSLYLANSVVSGNESHVGGVGIANAGVLTLFRSTVRDNVITGGGGGVTGVGAGILNIQFAGQTATPFLLIVESTISNNTGIRGGGIWNNGRVNIDNSTISGNTASLGGGIHNLGALNISFSTITDNEAGRETGEPIGNRVGGGISNFGGQVNIDNTILAGNRDRRTSADPLFAPDCFSSAGFRFISFTGNLVGILNANCNLVDPLFNVPRFDQFGTPADPLNPLLDPLADNGGPTKTHALRPDSPAINGTRGFVIDNNFVNCLKTDQRGRTRGAGIHCDVGAFEFDRQSIVPFAAFSVPQLKIQFSATPNQDAFELRSGFTLSSTTGLTLSSTLSSTKSNGINPLTEPVTLQFGTFTITIPPGSFKRHEDEDEDEHEHGDGIFSFHGVIDGVRLKAVIKQTGTLRYAFHAKARDANLTGTKNPVPVKLTIGDDSGTTSVTATIN